MIPSEELERMISEFKAAVERVDADFATVYVTNMTTGAGVTGVYPLKQGATGKALVASMIAQAMYLKDVGIPGKVLLDTLASVLLVGEGCTGCGACDDAEQRPN